MNPFAKHLTASTFMEQIKKYLYFRLHERIKMDAPIIPKAYADPDMTISLDTGRNLVYFYFVVFSDVNDVTSRETHLTAMMQNPGVLFGVITDGQEYMIYEMNVNSQLVNKGPFSLSQMCHYLNTNWIELGLYPPLEVNDYSYTKSGGKPDLIIEKIDAPYLILSNTAVASGVANPIPLTMDMLTNLLGFTQNQYGDFSLNGFIVTESNGKFFHHGKQLTYLSQLQQSYRRDRGELKIDETKLPSFII